jgi:hypothetical protein
MVVKKAQFSKIAVCKQLFGDCDPKARISKHTTRLPVHIFLCWRLTPLTELIPRALSTSTAFYATPRRENAAQKGPREQEGSLAGEAA